MKRFLSCNNPLGKGRPRGLLVPSAWAQCDGQHVPPRVRKSRLLDSLDVPWPGQSGGWRALGPCLHSLVPPTKPKGALPLLRAVWETGSNVRYAFLSGAALAPSQGSGLVLRIRVRVCVSGNLYGGCWGGVCIRPPVEHNPHPQPRQPGLPSAAPRQCPLPASCAPGGDAPSHIRLVTGSTEIWGLSE